MSPIRFLCPVGILVLGGVPGRFVFWLHEPMHVLWAAAFPLPVPGESPCECGHLPGDHLLNHKGERKNCRACGCLFHRDERRVGLPR